MKGTFDQEIRNAIGAAKQPFNGKGGKRPFGKKSKAATAASGAGSMKGNMKPDTNAQAMAEGKFPLRGGMK